MHINLELPLPPSVNHYWGQSGKRRFIGKRGVLFRDAVVQAVIDAGVRPLEGRLAMHIAISPPDRRKRDLDNFCKSLLDACEHAGCFENDNQIDELHLYRKDIVKGGACNVVILELD